MLESPNISANALLIVSLLALLAGPLLFYFAKFNKNLLRGLDGFVFIAICGLVFLHILPHTVLEVGWIAIIVILAGMMLPTFVERVKSHLAGTAHTITLILAFLGIALHAFTDGMALADSLPRQSFHGNMLPMAVILHRVPDGLTIWWLLRPLYGNWSAIRTLVIMAIATILGYFFGQIVFEHLSDKGVGIFEAVVGGSLLHVIFHHSHPMQNEKQRTGREWAAGLGALIAILMILFLTLNADLSPSNSYLERTIKVFVALAMESAPALLLAYFFSGVIQTYLPRASAAWLKKGSSFSQALRGMIFGLPLPICSCGVIPVFRSLTLQGVPLAATIAFFVATPEFSIDAFLLSIPLLGARYTVWRLILAALVALSMGIIISRIAKKFPSFVKQDATCIDEPPPDLRGFKRFRHALRQGYVDAVDDTGPWIAVGLIIAALLEPFLQTSLSGFAIPAFLEVPFFALAGMPLYVCASGATPLVAILIHNGVSPGAGLAFLLTGPATNATTFAVVSKFHGRRIAVCFAVGMAVLSTSAGLLLNLVYDPGTLPEIFAHRHPGTLAAQRFFLAVLTIIFLYSLLRRGPRGMLAELMSFDAKEDTQHGHSHDHGMEKQGELPARDKQEHHDCCH